MTRWRKPKVGERLRYRDSGQVMLVLSHKHGLIEIEREPKDPKFGPYFVGPDMMGRFEFLDDPAASGYAEGSQSKGDADG